MTPVAPHNPPALCTGCSMSPAPASPALRQPGFDGCRCVTVTILGLFGDADVTQVVRCRACRDAEMDAMFHALDADAAHAAVQAEISAEDDDRAERDARELNATQEEAHS